MSHSQFRHTWVAGAVSKKGGKELRARESLMNHIYRRGQWKRPGLTPCFLTPVLGGQALWNAAGNYKFRGAQIWAGKGCRLPTGESLMPTEPWGKSVQQDHLTTACNDRTCFKSPNQRPHFRAESSTSHAEDTAPSWKQLFLRSERNLWMLRARSARAFDNVTKVTGPSTLKK